VSTKVPPGASGNTYADLGFESAEEHALNVKRVGRISIVKMNDQELTQTAAGPVGLGSSGLMSAGC
jgi:hypothetical protein